MLSFVKFDDYNGIWANRDKVLEFMDKGFHIYKDNVNWEELTRSDLEAMSEHVTTGLDSDKKETMYSV